MERVAAGHAPRVEHAAVIARANLLADAHPGGGNYLSVRPILSSGLAATGRVHLVARVSGRTATACRIDHLSTAYSCQLPGTPLS
jgi:hypothetical protein